MTRTSKAIANAAVMGALAVVVAGLIAQAPRQRQRDFSELVVMVHHAPFNCAPCDLLESHKPDIQAMCRGAWFGKSIGDQQPRTLKNGWGDVANYNATKADLCISGYPTVIVYREGREVYRKVGYAANDMERVKCLIRWAAE